MQVNKTTVPQSSLAATSFPVIHYKDAFTCSFISTKKIEIDDLVYAFFNSAPGWVKKMMEVRNSLVKRLGLKTGSVEDKEALLKNFKLEKGNAAGLFKVFDKKENEVLIGEDDKHLNFRISFFLVQNELKQNQFTLSTTVQMNNWLGRLYFLPVRPFHKLIVPSMMKAMIKHLNGVTGKA